MGAWLYQRGEQSEMKKWNVCNKKLFNQKQAKYRQSKSHEKREIYSINEWWKKREENIFDQRVVKRKTGKYIRSTSGEKKERKIYAIKEWLKERQRNIFDQRVVKRKKGKYMRSNQGLVHDGAQGKCNHIWKNVLSAERSSTEIDFLSQSLLVLDPTTSCALVFESHNPFFLLQKLFLLFKKDNSLYWGSQIPSE